LEKAKNIHKLRSNLPFINVKERQLTSKYDLIDSLKNVSVDDMPIDDIPIIAESKEKAIIPEDLPNAQNMEEIKYNSLIESLPTTEKGIKRLSLSKKYGLYKELGGKKKLLMLMVCIIIFLIKNQFKII